MKKKLWAGYCDDEIAVIQNLSGHNTIELFTNKKHAKKCYHDIRPVEIRELNPK